MKKIILLMLFKYVIIYKIKNFIPLERKIITSMKKEEGKKSEIKWFLQITVIAFILSIIFSFISNNAVSILPILPAIIVLVIVVGIGILFDILGVAVTVAKDDEFNAKATKKAKGAKTSLYLIKNSSKVANICADVIGDICRST